MVRLVFAILLSLVLCGAGPAARPDSTDSVAADYAELALGALLLRVPADQITTPLSEALAEARTAARDADRIRSDAQALVARLDALPIPADPRDAMRLRTLRARIVSMGLDLAPPDPARTVDDDVRLRFGFSPRYTPLTAYDPALDDLDRAMPGEGTLFERVERMRAAAAVPPDRIEPVFRAALEECRRRTEPRVSLPPHTVEVQFVEDPTTPASAQYVGGGRTIIRVSTVIPTDVDRLLQHACHEGFPGHHVHQTMMDTALFRSKGWSEYGVGIDDAPLFPTAESVAEHGVGLAFPVEDRIAFSRDVLYPLAGLSMRNETWWRAYHQARPRLLGASATIARGLLMGELGEDEARDLFVRYRLQPPQAAAQTVRMVRAFGSYLIASDLGWQAVDEAMRGAGPDEQWRRLAIIQREPMLLDDLTTLADPAARP